MEKEKRFGSENLPPEMQAVADRMNLDPDAVPAYTLPQFTSRTAAEFMRTERPRILRDFGRYMYGDIPPRCASTDAEVQEEDPAAFGGLATRREITVRCAGRGQARYFHMLLYVPNDRKGRVPVFFGLNFKGNHACSADPGVLFHMTKRYPTLGGYSRFADGRSGPEGRACAKDRWCFEDVLRRGYAAATVCYWELYPDHPWGFHDSVLPLFFGEDLWESEERPCGAISAWSWGISRALDVLEQQPEIDGKRMIVHGLSRLGKAALWAGANDERVALTVSCCSGTCGAKLAHRYYGEDFGWVDLWNPHWTVPAFRRFVGNDGAIPVDAHQLIACVAPRLAFVASATEDVYADPQGEFLAAAHAADAYRLFGSAGIGTDIRPAPDTLLTGDVGYFLRTGVHNCTPENWKAFLDYADVRLKAE